MNPAPLSRRTRSAAAWLLLLGAALGVRLLAVVAPPEHLITLVPDDAFYYFETAQRLIDGEGSTFDGIDRADGFQPLWMGLLTLVAWLPPLTFVRTALVLGILLHLFAAMGLARFVAAVTERAFFGWLAAAAYLGNRWATFSSFNGLETALTSAIFCWLLVMCHRTVEDHRTQPDVGPAHGLSWRAAIPVGLLAGLLFLARTDQVFYGAAFLLFVWFASGLHRVTALRLGIATLAVSLPWFVWHWASFGHPLPSSGSAQPFIQRTLTVLAGGSVEARSWAEMRGFFTGRIIDFPGFDRRILIPLLVAGGTTIVITWRRVEPSIRRALFLLGGLLTAGLALGFVHSYVRWYPRTWYFDQYIPLVVAVLLISAHQAQDFLHRNVRPLAPLVPVAVALVVLATAAVAQVKVWSYLERGIYTGQRQALDAAQRLDELLPAGAAVGGWNSGILAFFSRRSVLNLDGAISATTLDYLHDRDLTSLLCERRVHALVDHGHELDRYRPFLPGLDSLTAGPPIRIGEGGGGWIIQPLGDSVGSGTCATAVD